MNNKKYASAIAEMDTMKRFGKIHRVVGLMIESKGPEASIGDLCYIHKSDHAESIPAEVVGFHDENILLMPYREVREIRPGS